MDRKKITEWVKWFVWIFSLIGVYTEGRVSKAKVEERADIKLEQVARDIEELKEYTKDTRNYALTNKDNITRSTAILEHLVD